MLTELYNKVNIFPVCIYHGFSPHLRYSLFVCLFVCLFFHIFPPRCSSPVSTHLCLSDIRETRLVGLRTAAEPSPAQYGTNSCGRFKVRGLCVGLRCSCLTVLSNISALHSQSARRCALHVLRMFAFVPFSVQLYWISCKTNAIVRSGVLSKCAGWLEQVVSRRPPGRPLTAEVRVPFRDSAREVCGGQSGTGRGFCPNTLVSCVSVIP